MLTGAHGTVYDCVAEMLLELLTSLFFVHLGTEAALSEDDGIDGGDAAYHAAGSAHRKADKYRNHGSRFLSILFERRFAAAVILGLHVLRHVAPGVTRLLAAPLWLVINVLKSAYVIGTVHPSMRLRLMYFSEDSADLSFPP